ncbi:MAG: peptide chain release factor N(5)-glutamine methyltransferase [Lachnospiraceae bacterium]|nr:peptide chain release factor N(5)-glutamine methyltransferase [Lachnospiraceae bacterium]
MQYQEIYGQGREVLEKAGVEEASLDARLLLEEVCGTDRTVLYAHGDKELTEAEETRYLEMIKDREKRIPLQHILGEAFFMGLTFLVNENVLCPRPDTEVLVEEVLKHLHDGMKILDIGTGSGCILLSLLHYSNDCRGVGVDISAEALQVARENGKRLAEERAEFLESDLFENVEGKFEIIVSNPPYIRSGEIAHLMPEVRDHEPHGALDGGDDGLLFYREITNGAKKHLHGGGMLFYEIGCEQGEAVRHIMEEAGYLEVQVIKDFSGLDRVVCGIVY